MVNFYITCSGGTMTSYLIILFGKSLFPSFVLYWNFFIYYIKFILYYFACVVRGLSCSINSKVMRIMSMWLCESGIKACTTILQHITYSSRRVENILKWCRLYIKMVLLSSYLMFLSTNVKLYIKNTQHGLYMNIVMLK